MGLVVVEPVDADHGGVEVAAEAAAEGVQGDGHQVLDDGALPAQVHGVPYGGDVFGGDQLGEYVLPRGLGEQFADLLEAVVGAFGGGEYLRAVDQAPGAVGGQLVQVLADGRGFLAQCGNIAAVYWPGDQVGSVVPGHAGDDELADQVRRLRGDGR